MKDGEAKRSSNASTFSTGERERVRFFCSGLVISRFAGSHAFIYKIYNWVIFPCVNISIEVVNQKF